MKKWWGRRTKRISTQYPTTTRYGVTPTQELHRIYKLDQSQIYRQLKATNNCMLSQGNYKFEIVVPNALKNYRSNYTIQFEIDMS